MIHDHMIRHLKLVVIFEPCNPVEYCIDCSHWWWYGNACPERRAGPSERLFAILATFSLLTTDYIDSDIRGEKNG